MIPKSKNNCDLCDGVGEILDPKDSVYNPLQEWTDEDWIKCECQASQEQLRTQAAVDQHEDGEAHYFELKYKGAL